MLCPNWGCRGCPDSVRGNICSGIMLWRVPTPGFTGARPAGSAASQALAAGKAMVDAWRSARLTPARWPKVDPEDFLAMKWWDSSDQRVIPVFNERMSRYRCRCGNFDIDCVNHLAPIASTHDSALCPAALAVAMRSLLRWPC